MRYHIRYSDSHFITPRIICCFALSYSSFKIALEARRYFYLRASFIIFITLES